MKSCISENIRFVIILTGILLSMPVLITVSLAQEPTGFDALMSFDHLPLLKEGIVCLQHSSFDRTGGNDDGFSGRFTHLRRTEAGEFVIFDAKGPGIIYRFWSAQPPEGYIKFFFDDETEPRLTGNFREMFQDKLPPFAPPLTGTSSGGWYSYHPIPFAKRCVIVTEKQTGFLAITYHKYPEGTQVKTFTPELSPEDKEKYDAIQKWFVDPSAPEMENLLQIKWSKIPSGAGEFTLADITGSGTIERIHMKVRRDMPEKWVEDHTLRQTVLRIYWDGDRRPAIEAPIGDFFGTGFGDRQPKLPEWTTEPLIYSAVNFGMTEDFYYFRMPMPFRRSARITVENGTGGELDLGFGYDLKRVKVPANAGYFHAQWRDYMTVEGEHVPILETTGRGHYIGTVLSMQSPHWLTYLEGDEKFYVDGEEFPSIHGTGTEDYFNCGWYYNQGVVSRPFHGLTVMRDPQSRTSQYRIHIPDFVPFTESLKVEIEHGESNNKPDTNYAIMAYWYQDSTSHDVKWTLPPASELRFPGTVITEPQEPWVSFAPLAPSLDVEAILQSGGGTARLVPLNELNESFRGAPQLLISADSPGAFLRWEVSCSRDDLYSIELFAIRNPQSGIAELFIDGESTGQRIILYSDRFHQAHISFDKPVFMKEGTRWLELRAVERHEQRAGWNMILSAYLIKGASPWAKEWNILGSFPGGHDFGYGTVYPPEQSVDLTARYRGTDERDISWLQIKANDILWLHDKLLPNNNIVAYAHTFVWSPDDREADALISTDDAGKLFINSELVWGIPGVNHLKLDEFTVPIRLTAGWNEVLLKVCQSGGYWGFSFRIVDPKSELVYSVNKQLPERKPEGN